MQMVVVNASGWASLAGRRRWWLTIPFNGRVRVVTIGQITVVRVVIEAVLGDILVTP